jgi:hypothetical protein
MTVNHTMVEKNIDHFRIAKGQLEGRETIQLKSRLLDAGSVGSCIFYCSTPTRSPKPLTTKVHWLPGWNPWKASNSLTR